MQEEGDSRRRPGCARRGHRGSAAPHSSSLLMASSASALSGPAVPDMGSAPSSPLSAGPARQGRAGRAACLVSEAPGHGAAQPAGARRASRRQTRPPLGLHTAQRSLAEGGPAATRGDCHSFASSSSPPKPQHPHPAEHPGHSMAEGGPVATRGDSICPASSSSPPRPQHSQHAQHPGHSLAEGGPVATSGLSISSASSSSSRSTSVP